MQQQNLTCDYNYMLFIRKQLASSFYKLCSVAQPSRIILSASTLKNFSFLTRSQKKALESWLARECITEIHLLPGNQANFVSEVSLVLTNALNGKSLSRNKQFISLRVLRTSGVGLQDKFFSSIVDDEQLSAASPQALTRLLTQAPLTQEILYVCHQASFHFNEINLATAFVRLAKTNRSYALVQNPDFRELCYLVQEKIESFPIRELCNISWALTTMGILDTSLLGAIEKAAQKHFENLTPAEFNLLDLFFLVWSFATLGHNCAPEFESTVKLALANQENVADLGTLSTLCWSYAVLENRSPELFALLFRRIAEFPAPAENPTILRQIKTVLLYLQYLAPEIEKPHLSAEWQDCLVKINAGLYHRRSLFEHEFRLELAKIIAGFKFGYSLEIFQLDFADPLHKINIECDKDYFHYTSRGTLKGGNRLRDRILTALGWQVIRIKTSEWQSASIKSTLIKERLQALNIGLDFY